MNLSTTLRSGIHLRFLISLALTAAIVAPFLLLGRASAVTLELDCPEATVQRGDEFFCDMTLTFRDNLRIQDLEFVATGPTDIQAKFLLFGKLKSKSPQVKDVILLSVTDNGYNYGYSYGYGYGYGYG